MTAEEQALTMQNDSRPKLKYYLAWARTYLRRGDAVENSARGIWALTEIGEKIKSREQTDAIQKQVSDEERERARKKRVAAKGSYFQNPVTTDPDEFGVDSWDSELLSILKSMIHLHLKGFLNVY